MVKSYLKYEHSKTFGVINTSTANVIWSEGEESDSSNSLKSTGSGRAVVAANEEVICWDIKRGEIVSRWRDLDCRSQVTAIVQSKTNKDIFAVGYEDGSIRIWDSKISTIILIFNGHRSAITILRFDCHGTRLASGSKDTDVIVWDLVAEVGLFKLRGHKDQITGLHFLQTGLEEVLNKDEGTISAEQPNFEKSEVFLLTTSKDALIKLWDMESQHCIETHVAQTNGECWSLGVLPDGAGCITAGNDGELTVWSINSPSLIEFSRQVDQTGVSPILRNRGILRRQGKDRTQGISFHPRQDYFAVYGSEKAIEVWRMRSEDEVRRSLARKRKRRREKQATTGEIDDGTSEELFAVDIAEFFISYLVVRTGGKVCSMDWLGKSSKAIQVLVATTNNQLEVYSIITKDKSKKVKTDETPYYSRGFSVEIPGHKADIRALALSSDDKMLASASNGGLKVWNIKTGSCIRTFECGYALCCAFLPGDKIIAIGTKSGELELFDVVSATMLDSVEAHEGAIWTLQVHPDGRSLVSGSADKSAKFWDFQLIQEEIPGTRRTTSQLRLNHTRSLKVTDDILSLRFSPDARLLAVALLDNTVKVFFVDSLKLFLNLYGHRLPVLNMDISFDSKLIVTCSADKNIRLWGLDFGDCHKAFFAHQDSILQVAFVPHNQDGNGHHFFSSSKDKMIKYWDGDKFEQIQRLDGHFGEIWALAVSRTGDFLVSASHDKSIRVWEQTDEQIFLEEEKEKELEELYENTLATTLEQDQAADEDTETGVVSKQTIATLTAGEKIAEALEISLADLELMRRWEAAKGSQPNLAPPSRNLLFMALGGISAEEHVLSVLQKVQAAEIDDALLVLPFTSVLPLFTFLEIFTMRSMNIPLTCRILFFMLKTHYQQIVASKTMKSLLERIRGRLRQTLQRQKAEMGYSLAALWVIGTQVEERNVKDYIDEQRIADSSNQRKRGFVSVS